MGVSTHPLHRKGVSSSMLLATLVRLTKNILSAKGTTGQTLTSFATITHDTPKILAPALCQS